MNDDPLAIEPTSNSPKLQRTPRPRPVRQLPTDRVSFTKQLDILRAFAILGATGKAVSNEQVAQTVGMAPATTGLCNPFFVDTQLLQKIEGGWVPSTDTLAYERASKWDSENAATKLQPTIERTWFAQLLTPRLKFRAFEEREAIVLLADESGASIEYEPQLRTIIAYLEASGIVSRDNGMIKYRGGGTNDLAPSSGSDANSELREEKPRVPAQSTSTRNGMPIPLGRHRLAYIELPDDWESAKDLARLLKMLELSLGEGEI